MNLNQSVGLCMDWPQGINTRIQSIHDLLCRIEMWSPRGSTIQTFTEEIWNLGVASVRFLNVMYLNVNISLGDFPKFSKALPSHYQRFQCPSVWWAPQADWRSFHWSTLEPRQCQGWKNHNQYHQFKWAMRHCPNGPLPQAIPCHYTVQVSSQASPFWVAIIPNEPSSITHFQ